MAITLTPRAADKVRELMSQPAQAGAKGLRIKVVGGGCSGFSYELALERETAATDKVYESNGVTVIVDPKSHLFVGGTEIDYHEGMMGSGFAFTNPNSKGSCGCGKSFTA